MSDAASPSPSEHSPAPAPGSPIAERLLEPHVAQWVSMPRLERLGHALRLLAAAQTPQVMRVLLAQILSMEEVAGAVEAVTTHPVQQLAELAVAARPFVERREARVQQLMALAAKTPAPTPNHATPTQRRTM